ncbi:MAG: 2-dehydro-3-deoxygalactonokinase, partial [Chloroflexota bacterium]
FTGTVCLPGTHSKWCKVENGRLVAFHTLIIGEMFELLCKHSLLRHSVGKGWDERVFKESATRVVLHGDDPLANLFTIRAEGLLTEMPGGVAMARLSGILIGAELRAMGCAHSRAEVVLIGSNEQCARYVAALDVIGTPTRVFSGDVMVVKGLLSLAAKFFQCPTEAA